MAIKECPPALYNDIYFEKIPVTSKKDPIPIHASGALSLDCVFSQGLELRHDDGLVLLNRGIVGHRHVELPRMHQQKAERGDSRDHDVRIEPFYSGSYAVAVSLDPKALLFQDRFDHLGPPHRRPRL